jgi:division protein CdvB (Snf7/Vps24/ESCRT-III family)
MSDFSSSWNSREGYSDGFTARLRNVIKSPEPLRPKLEVATNQIKVQIVKLGEKSQRLSEKDQLLFAKIVSFVQEHDVQRANMFANELSEIRKMGKVVTQAKLAFEQIELRMNTIKDIGDVASALSPAIGIIRGLAPGISNLIPEAQSEIGEISTLLSGILVDAGQLSHGSINFETANDEAEKVLAEAGVVAELDMQDKFPDLPSSLRTRSPDSEEGAQPA